jgi:hypothetical protein
MHLDQAAENAQNISILSITLLALSLGLRICEAASIRPLDIIQSPTANGIYFQPEKMSP